MKCRSCPPYQRSKPLVMPPKYWDQIFPSVMGGTGRCDLWIPLIRKPRMSGAPGQTPLQTLMNTASWHFVILWLMGIITSQQLIILHAERQLGGGLRPFLH